MFQLLSIVSCCVTTHIWDQSVSVFPIPATRWVAIDGGKLCHCQKKRINHCRFKWYREESTILAFHMKANKPLHLSSWGGTSPLPSASLLMSHTPLCQCFPGTVEHRTQHGTTVAHGASQVPNKKRITSALCLLHSCYQPHVQLAVTADPHSTCLPGLPCKVFLWTVDPSLYCCMVLPWLSCIIWTSLTSCHIIFPGCPSD